jgi:hypothetical protein
LQTSQSFQVQYLRVHDTWSNYPLPVNNVWNQLLHSLVKTSSIFYQTRPQWYQKFYSFSFFQVSPQTSQTCSPSLLSVQGITIRTFFPLNSKSVLWNYVSDCLTHSSSRLIQRCFQNLFQYIPQLFFFSVSFSFLLVALTTYAFFLYFL